jgi:hypothetical protein
MNANIPKQPKPPKAWQLLPMYQKKSIEKYCQDVALRAAWETTQRDARIMLDIYTKMVCCVLHDSCGMNEDELLCFLGNHRQLFRRQRIKVADNTQLDYLNGRMAEIFPTSGFPQQFFDDMLGEVEEPGREEVNR